MSRFPRITARMSIRAHIHSDLYRYTGRTDLKAFARLYLTNRGFNYMVWHRLAQSRNRWVARFSRLKLSFKMRKFGIHIPASTRVGYGLYIGHGGPCIVHPTAVIGNNCNLSQFVTIGSNVRQSATIGDNVYIGPGVCVVEKLSIGDRATIGAGSVVTRDVPANATAVGSPAKPISTDRPGFYIQNPWPLQDSVF